MKSGFIFVAALVAGLLLLGCVSQGQQQTTPTPTAGATGAAQDIQTQANNIPLPSIELPSIGGDTGFENQPVSP